MIAGLLEDGLYTALRFNPCVAIHELRLRMRGIRPFLVLLFYTLVAIGTVLIALGLQILQWRGSYNPIYTLTDVGRTTFAVLAYTQLTLIVFVLPAYAAGAITMERERQTLDMLRVTQLSPSDVVSGKLLVVLAFGLVLLVTSVPVAAWCLLFGGVEPVELFYVYTHLLAVSACVTALGMLLSAALQKSIGAIVGTYMTLLLFLAGLPLLYLLIVEETRNYSTPNTTLGVGAASLVVAGCVLALGTLLFAALRGLTRWLFRGRAALLGFLLAALITLAALGPLLVWGADAAISALSQLAPTSPLALHPYVALTIMLYPEGAEGLLTDYNSTLKLNQPVVQTLTWAVAAGALVGVALLLWLLATRALRLRNAAAR